VTKKYVIRNVLNCRSVEYFARPQPAQIELRNSKNCTLVCSSAVRRAGRFLCAGVSVLALIVGGAMSSVLLIGTGFAFSDDLPGNPGGSAGLYWVAGGAGNGQGGAINGGSGFLAVDGVGGAGHDSTSDPLVLGGAGGAVGAVTIGAGVENIVGGAGDKGASSKVSSGGGGGGAGAFLDGGEFSLIGGSSVIGGRGGDGGAALYGGSGGGGGGGGAGVIVRGGTLINSMDATIRGGAGGNGVNATSARQKLGDGGGGGDGIVVENGASFTNLGAIFGGAAGKAAENATAYDGMGGAGIRIGSDSHVINGGSISSGFSNRGVSNTVDIVGSNNIFEIWDGSDINGKVVVATGTSGNTFALGGDVNSTFDVSGIGVNYVGFQQFGKLGSSTWKLTGTSTLSTPWTVSGGLLDITSDEALGAVAGAVTLDGGGLSLDGNFDIYRDIVVGNSGGRIETENGENTLRGNFSGSGTFTKSGNGTLLLLNDSSGLTGLTQVNSGQLEFDRGAKIGGNLSVSSGASIAGTGTVGGVGTFAGGSTLYVQTGSPMTFGRGLTFQPGSTLDVTLTGSPSETPLISVNGDLALNGTLNVSDNSFMGSGDGGPGVYRIINYTGSLTSNNMTLGHVPEGYENLELQTYDTGHVNIVNTQGMVFRYWDGGDPANYGDGKINGGDGQWNNAGGNDSWTDTKGQLNGEWTDHSFAVFQGVAGRVTIDQNFSPTVTGMQFFVDGYMLDGGSINLNGSDTTPIINVGNGQTSSSSFTAIVNSRLTGGDASGEGLRKTGYGTLILTADNDYLGSTTVSEGTLQIGNGGTTGGILSTSDIKLERSSTDYGRLVIDRSDDIEFENNISGEGQVTQKGQGAVTFTGDNSFSGGLTVLGGEAHAGRDGNSFGTGQLRIATGAKVYLDDHDTTVGGIAASNPKSATSDGDIVLGSGTLTLNQKSDGTFAGAISGTGGLTMSADSKGSSLTLYGASDYTGTTQVYAGTLIQGRQGGFSGGSTYNVSEGAGLQLGGFDTNMVSLSNDGTVRFGGGGGTTLTVEGNYVGHGGTLVMTSNLDGDDSKTDMLKVTGSTEGDTTLQIVNRGGFGAQTVNGIKVIDVGGESNGNFALKGDYVTKDGQQAIMTSSAFAYTLQKNSVADPNGGNWYLVSQNTKTDPNPNPNPNPEPGRYSAAAPIYQAYADSMQALNRMPTLQQRVGDRYFDDVSAIVRLAGEGGEPATVASWARVDGAHERLQNDTSSGRLMQGIDTILLQTGVDGEFYEDSNGRLIGGLTGQFGQSKSRISNYNGDGTVETQGWGFGGTLTWYDNDGFYADGQVLISSYSTDLSSDTLQKQLSNGNKGTGYAGSVEVGQRYILDDNWSVTPQAQLSWSSVRFDEFKDVYGANIRDEGGDSMIGRFGFSAKYSDGWQGGDGKRIEANLYGSANFYQEFLGGTRINYSGTLLDNNTDPLWAGMGLGGSYRWADKKYTIYGEGTMNTSINHIGDSYAFKATIGFQAKL